MTVGRAERRAERRPSFGAVFTEEAVDPTTSAAAAPDV